jgi:hypothetical protein
VAGSFSDYLEKALLDATLGGPTFALPATVYVGLFTVTPADSGGGTEVSGNNYARKSTTNNATNWPAASGTTATKSNGTAITFVQATPSGWGTIVAFGIFDALTTGNLLVWGDVTPNKAVGALDTPEFATGALVVTLD